MNNQQRVMFKTSMIYGTYLAGISIVLTVIIWAGNLMEYLGLFGSMFIGVFQLILLVFLLLYFTKRYRINYLGNRITFKQAFVFGLTVVIVSTIISSFYNYIFNKFIDPEYMKRIMTMMQEKTYQWMSSKGLPEDQIDTAMKRFDSQAIPTPIESVISSLKFGIIGGVIMSLLSSAIIKKNVANEDAFDEAMEEVKNED